MNQQALIVSENGEPQALTAQQIMGQVASIQELMRLGMRNSDHYGVIPGCVKPSLLKPGAEKLCLMFRLGARYKIDKLDLGNGHREITVTCALYHINTGAFWGEGVGSCSTMETKYRYRGNEAISTGVPVPKGYWELKKTDFKAAQELLGGSAYMAKKLDEGWMICEKGQKQENPDIADTYNTVLKIAKKRALVDGTLNATAASDIFTQDAPGEDELKTKDQMDKAEWQRKDRANFKETHGYSKTAHYGAGGQREDVLKRDGFKCVLCGMTDEQHKAKWNRPITVDHIDKDRTNNTMENLQTLCLSCHGSKDIKPELTEQQVVKYKADIIQRRKQGETYQSIADDLGFSIASIWKWHGRWTNAPVAKPAPVEAKPATPSQPEPEGVIFGKRAEATVQEKKTADDNYLTDRFAMPKKMTDKEGREYWVTLDSEGARLYINEKVVADVISQNEDKRLTVEVKKTAKGNTRIIGVV